MAASLIGVLRTRPGNSAQVLGDLERAAVRAFDVLADQNDAGRRGHVPSRSALS